MHDGSFRGVQEKRKNRDYRTGRRRDPETVRGYGGRFGGGHDSESGQGPGKRTAPDAVRHVQMRRDHYVSGKRYSRLYVPGQGTREEILLYAGQKGIGLCGR